MTAADLEIRPNVYYTLDETAALLRVSRRSIVTMLENGIAQDIKIGRRWRILGRDILQISHADELNDAQMTQAMMRLSEPAFTKIWDNDEDAVYDSL